MSPSLGRLPRKELLVSPYLKSGGCMEVLAIKFPKCCELLFDLLSSTFANAKECLEFPRHSRFEAANVVWNAS